MLCFCDLLVLLYSLVHSNEENDVLQHAYTYCSEEPGRDAAHSEGEEENYVTVTRRMHQDTQSRPQECMYTFLNDFNSYKKIVCCFTKLRNLLSSGCILSLKVSSPKGKLVVSLPARWGTVQCTWLKVQSTEVTQPMTPVAIQPWSTKYSTRLTH